jgi:hypothetical protein
MCSQQSPHYLSTLVSMLDLNLPQTHRHTQRHRDRERNRMLCRDCMTRTLHDSTPQKLKPTTVSRQLPYIEIIYD